MLEPHPHRVVADAQGGGQFGQRGVRVFFDVGLKFGRVEFAPSPPTRFGRQRVGFSGGEIAVNGAFTQLEPPRGFGAGATCLHKLHYPFP